MDSKISLYLKKYAEPEAKHLRTIQQQFGHALCIPVYGEDKNFLKTLNSIPKGELGNVLCIVVLNASKKSPIWAHQNNKTLFQLLKNQFGSPETISKNPSLHLFKFRRGHILLINRATGSHQFFPHQGVGLARKIAGDIALALYHKNQIRSPWIHCTDADVLLPSNYFKRLREISTSNIAAIIYPFHFLCDKDPKLGEAAKLFEIYMRYYLLGIADAKTPHLYNITGPTITYHASAYAKIKGYAKFKSGEDFYLLNQIEKVGSIHNLVGSPVLIHARISTRTPKGLGTSLAQILSQDKKNKAYMLFHPSTFIYLAALIQILKQLSLPQSKTQLQSELKKACTKNSSLNFKIFKNSLNELNAFSRIKKIRKKFAASSNLLYQLHCWFDNKRSFQFMNALVKQGIKAIPYKEALAKAPFIKINSLLDLEDTEKMRQELQIQVNKVFQKPSGTYLLKKN